MNKPYDDFDSIPDLKDLTPWDSIHLDQKTFKPYLESFLPDRISIQPYKDKHAIWFGNEFAILVKVSNTNKIKQDEETGELFRKNLLVTDGALISNGITIKEVLNANLKFKKCRRVAFDFRRIIFDLLHHHTNIDEIAGVSISSLCMGTYGSQGTPLTKEETERFKNKQAYNKDVPAPLIKVADRPLASNRTLIKKRT